MCMCLSFRYSREWSGSEWYSIVQLVFKYKFTEVPDVYVILYELEHKYDLLNKATYSKSP